MEEPLKARLIGAAVLVAVAVLLIPELLSGRKAVAPVVEEGAGARGTRTFTIELGQGRGPANTASAGASAGATTPPPPRPAAEPVPEPQTETQTEPPSDLPVSSAENVKAPVTVPAPAVALAQPQPPPAPAATSGGWVVQVGAFGSADAARKLVAELGGTGYRAFVSPVTRGGKTLHRVRVGPEPEKPGAERLAQQLKARGLPATVVQND
ncbi:MAG: SPOR domain-containing protein [Steroidobacteraceae bacterium]|nr:SPOR domain-containing protein [Steroidobacteraceae bacterium]